MSTGEPQGFGSIVGGTSTSSSLFGALSGLGAVANTANAQAQGLLGQYQAYQASVNPITYSYTTHNGAQFITGATQEVKKIAKKAFAALMDEITEWHGDILTV